MQANDYYSVLAQHFKTTFTQRGIDLCSNRRNTEVDYYL